MGDPAGIGPEIIVKAAERLLPRIEAGDLRLLVIGSNVALEHARAAGNLSHGDRVLCSAFGAGLTWGSCILTYGAPTA
jgi:4-hydroxy-L-threonine phosphate dehydrogenase PdxA